MMADMVQTQLMTLEAFEAFENRPENRERGFELIEGVPVEKMVTQLHAYIVVRLILRLGPFVEQHKLGWVGTETSIRIPNHDERRPDITVFLSQAIDDVPATTMPDLAVEIKSPSNTYTDLRDKAAFYLAHGAKLVWLVYPEKRLVEIFAAGGGVDILTDNDTLTGGEVLPGFSLPVRDIFAM